MLSLPWTRLVRFVDQHGKIRYGDLKAEDAQEAELLEGEGVFSLRSTGVTVPVGQLLGPLTPADVPLVRCIGLNYATHRMYDCAYARMWSSLTDLSRAV